MRRVLLRGRPLRLRLAAPSERRGHHLPRRAPQDWDKHGQRVKTDGRDARELVEALARYEAGNKHALALVRVPGIAQEQSRALSRQRGALVNFLQSLLEPLRALLVELEARIKKLTAQIIGNEALDWERFSNRRQISSFTGLCPSEHSSGGSRRQGSINKHGNPRLRHALIEAVWRLMRHQPGWKRLEKVMEKLKALEGKKSPEQKEDRRGPGTGAGLGPVAAGHRAGDAGLPGLHRRRGRRAGTGGSRKHRATTALSA